MNNGTQVDLVKFRLEQAHECLLVAKANISTSLKASVNRSYYCIFHAMRAVLATKGFDSKKHSGVISEFRKTFIKPGVFERKHSDIIGKAFEIRNESDYEDFYVVSKEEAMKQIENAKEFLEACEKYLEGVLEANT